MAWEANTGETLYNAVHWTNERMSAVLAFEWIIRHSLAVWRAAVQWRWTRGYCSDWRPARTLWWSRPTRYTNGTDGHEHCGLGRGELRGVPFRRLPVVRWPDVEGRWPIIAHTTARGSVTRVRGDGAVRTRLLPAGSGRDQNWPTNDAGVGAVRFAQAASRKGRQKSGAGAAVGYFEPVAVATARNPITVC